MAAPSLRFRGPRAKRGSRSVPPRPLAASPRSTSEALALLNGAEAVVHASGARTTSAAVDEVRFAALSGGDVLEIPRRTAYTQTFHLPAGATLRWEFRVHARDLGFQLRSRRMARGGAVEEDLIEPRRYGAAR